MGISTTKQVLNKKSNLICNRILFVGLLVNIENDYQIRWIESWNSWSLKHRLSAQEADDVGINPVKGM
jgi:hypothetical protein